MELLIRKPKRKKSKHPLLFVHGAWHGAWCWDEHFLDYFAKKGYVAAALSLPAHGNSPARKSLRAHRIADYVDAVEHACEELGGDPVLVGHSMGGFIVQKLLERRTPRAAVLMASSTNVLMSAWRVFRYHPRAFVKINLELRLYPLVTTPELCRSHFFSKDMPEDQVRAYTARMGDESYFAFLDMLALALPRARPASCPFMVLGAENDTIFKARQVRAMARKYGVEAEFFPNMAHDMMLEADWQLVADRIMRFMREEVN